MVDGSMDGLVDGSVDDGLVDRLGVVALAVDLMDLSVVGVLDVHDDARIGIVNLVGHSLEATVGEGNVVLAVGRIAVPGLIGTKLDGVGVAIVGINAILVLVVGRSVLWLFVGGGVVGGCGLVNGGVIGGAMEVGRGGQGNGQECGEGNEDLDQI